MLSLRLFSVTILTMIHSGTEYMEQNILIVLTLIELGSIILKDFGFCRTPVRIYGFQETQVSILCWKDRVNFIRTQIALSEADDIFFISSGR